MRVTYLIFYLLIVTLFSASTYGQAIEKGITLKGSDEPGKRWALLIGINDYIETSIADLSKARNDAKSMSELLQKKGEFDYVFTMTDDLDYRSPLFPTKANIETKVNAIAEEAEPNDTILVFFSGHGVNDSNGNGYLLPVDTKIKDPNGTAVQVEGVVGKLKKIKKSLLILDACRDVINKDEKSLGQAGLKEKKFEQAEISATLYSTRAGYVSYEEPEFTNGVYTNFLLAGLKGEADSNQDGIVSLSELDIYAQESVNDWAIKNHKQQKPFTKFYKEKSGDIGIAKAQKKPTPKATHEEENTQETDGKDKITLTISPVVKSALLPGWGQYSKGQTIRASLFFGGFILAGGFLFNTSSSHSGTITSYENAKNLSLLSIVSSSQSTALPLAAYGFMNAGEARSSGATYSSQFSVGLGILAIIYLYNVFDAYYMPKAETNSGQTSSFQWNLSYAREATWETKSMPRYLLEFTWRF